MSHTTRKRGNGWDKETNDNDNDNKEDDSEGNDNEKNVTTKTMIMNSQVGLTRMSHMTRKRGNGWNKETIDNNLVATNDRIMEYI